MQRGGLSSELASASIANGGYARDSSSTEKENDDLKVGCQNSLLLSYFFCFLQHLKISVRFAHTKIYLFTRNVYCVLRLSKDVFG